MRFRIISLILTINMIYAVEMLPEDRDWRDYIGSGKTNIDMKGKATEVITILGKRMNEIISTFKINDHEEMKLLKANQDSWEVFAKSKAEYIADSYRGGTHMGLSYGYVMVDEYLRRISELKEMKKIKESP